MTLSVTPLTLAVGAEIAGVDLAQIGDAEFVQVERAWHRYGALLFRGQQLTDNDVLTFSHILRGLECDGRKRSTPGALGAGEVVWHTQIKGAHAPQAYLAAAD
jgi:alpha-ketoglutarate-dependent taurine dioxygenase